MMEEQSSGPEVQQPVRTTVSPPEQKGKKLIVSLAVLVVLLIGGIVGVYLWQHGKVSELGEQLSKAEKSSSSSTNAKPAPAVKTSAQPVTATDTLPNGTKVSYPLTAGNANVVWWLDGNNSDSADSASNGYMRVTNKRVIQFLSTVPMSAIQSACGTDYADETAFQMGLYDTNAKTLTLRNQYENCIDAMASGKGGKYASQAQQVKQTAADELNTWAGSLTVTK